MIRVFIPAIILASLMVGALFNTKPITNLDGYLIAVNCVSIYIGLGNRVIQKEKRFR